MAEKLKNILKNYLEGKNFKEINETISIETIWKDVVGKLISKNTDIISFKNKTLTIKTKTPVWRNELSFQKNNILEKIQKKISKNKINKIKLI